MKQRQVTLDTHIVGINLNAEHTKGTIRVAVMMFGVNARKGYSVAEFGFESALRQARAQRDNWLKARTMGLDPLAYAEEERRKAEALQPKPKPQPKRISAALELTRRMIDEVIETRGYSPLEWYY